MKLQRFTISEFEKFEKLFENPPPDSKTKTKNPLVTATFISFYKDHESGQTNRNMKRFYHATRYNPETQRALCYIHTGGTCEPDCNGWYYVDMVNVVNVKCSCCDSDFFIFTDFKAKPLSECLKAKDALGHDTRKEA